VSGLDYLRFDLSLRLNIVSFVDRDMVMRYFGGGVGHLKNTPSQQVPEFDPVHPSSEEMAVEEEDDDDDPCSGTNENLGTIVQQPSTDVIMDGGELEVSEDDDDDEDSDDDDEGGDQTDEDDNNDSGCSGDEEEEREEDYGYASP
jgi:hypothetical protein